MRSIYLIAALPLLAHCGSPQAENKSDTANEVPTKPAELGNTSGDTGREPGNATEPVADGRLGSVGPCLVQGKDRLEVAAIRAIGTEPFWGARVEGRCVTYSTPDDQQGTRVWTRYSQGPDGRGMWVGQLGGRGFQMRSRSEPGCSDGMSDKRYPIAVELIVNGEQRRGCAEPL